MIKTVSSIKQAVASINAINAIRETHKSKIKSVSRYVINMRGDRIKKWRKLS